jgi:hypothetical protein
MNNKAALLLSVAIGFGALAACSKPASDSAANASATVADSASDAANATAGATANATDGAMSAGGAVSPPNSPQNDAVNQAKGHIENAGYTDVTGLTKTPEGLWTGSAKKDGKTVHVSVDFKGAVSAK